MKETRVSVWTYATGLGPERVAYVGTVTAPASGGRFEVANPETGETVRVPVGSVSPEGADRSGVPVVL